ncbi:MULTISPECIES: hypothetical protein [unclassified Sphingomonas]|uniref:hypothetical protein n=1 Tax=unclassified Sphingomonas TaxID=196159 RepID=UPI00226AD4F7|nr:MULTISPECIES: hypothetical protein [unclassified Sphingomonas]
MADGVLWAKELREDIDSITADYGRLRRVAETGVDEDGEVHDAIEARAAATAAATQALIRVVLALDNLPELHGSFRGGPLPDIIAALDDLRRGRLSELFRPHPQSKGHLSTAADMLKMRAVTSVLVLERSGASNAEARKIVAKIFADAGHLGKKGAPVSASTLFQWCASSATGVIETTEQAIIADVMSKLPSVITRSDAITLTKVEAAKRL